MNARPLTPSQLYTERLTRNLRAHGGTTRRTPGQLPPRWTPPAPTEGADFNKRPDLEVGMIANLSDAFRALPEQARNEVAAIAADANRHGHSISVTKRATERRVFLGHALVRIAQHCSELTAITPLGERIAELMRAFVAHACADDAVLDPAIPIGAVIGGCNHLQAHKISELAKAFTAGDLALGVRNDGVFYIPTEDHLINQGDQP